MNIFIGAGVDGADDASDEISGFFLQEISLRGLLLIGCQQILLEELVSENFLEFHEILLTHVGLLANRVGNDVAVRVVRFVVERSIPPKIFQRNVHCLCHGGGLAAEHIPPDFTFIEAQTNGILTADG